MELLWTEDNLFNSVNFCFWNVIIIIIKSMLVVQSKCAGLLAGCPLLDVHCNVINFHCLCGSLVWWLWFKRNFSLVQTQTNFSLVQSLRRSCIHPLNKVWNPNKQNKDFFASNIILKQISAYISYLIYISNERGSFDEHKSIKAMCPSFDFGYFHIIWLIQRT